MAGVAHRKGVATREKVYRLLRCSASGLLKSSRQRLLFPSNRVIQFILTERSRNPPREFYHDPPHWTLKCCYGAFCTIWVRSGPFGYFMKLGAKRAELVQKFVPRSRVATFQNERTQSTPLEPKLTFWCISYYLGAFVTVWLPYETR